MKNILFQSYVFIDNKKLSGVTFCYDSKKEHQCCWFLQKLLTVLHLHCIGLFAVVECSKVHFLKYCT